MPKCRAGCRKGCLFVGESGYADYDNGWSLYIPGVTKESGTPQHRNGTGPLDIPFCDFETRGRVTAAPWKLCRDGTAMVYNIFGTNESLWDWSPDSARNLEAQDNRNFASRIWNLGGSKVFQTEIWKLAAALGCEGSYLQVGSKVRHGYLWNLTMRYPRACVPHPYVLLVGSVKIQPGLQNYNVTCNNCTLTNCIRGITNQTRVLVLRQPAFVMFPVKINGSWYDERGLELWREVEGALMCYRRGIGLIILGFVALVTLIASSITAALTLAQSVQTATFVNNLAQNVSVTLGTQEDIDKKLEDRLNALYDVVKFLGEEVQSIKLRLRVQCHADFR
ncbi:endogenous retrovirus group K member 13-1 Env polyprotein-like isoform X4 [Bubalus kerabau]|nr:endogenous retrovirus group K member 13-1 Env polyprotein-like isoform X4 [Bubalus carabanensis]XP_055420057.1 endogenous retrovirus group K member 13-1 Env polyprotein-like isoform X4 [Bubalus carabanensis]